VKTYTVTVVVSHVSTHQVEVRAKDEVQAMKMAQEEAKQYEPWHFAEINDSFEVTDATAVKVDDE
jgi:hypothetical protein